MTTEFEYDVERVQMYLTTIKQGVKRLHKKNLLTPLQMKFFLKVMKRIKDDLEVAKDYFHEIPIQSARQD